MTLKAPVKVGSLEFFIGLEPVMASLRLERG